MPHSAAYRAWLGVATSAMGLVSEILRPVLGRAYALDGLLTFGRPAWITFALRWHTSVSQRPSQS